jgi:hypothetical protein
MDARKWFYPEGVLSFDFIENSHPSESANAIATTIQPPKEDATRERK